MILTPSLALARARAVLKHKGAFSGGIRRATVLIPRRRRRLLLLFVLLRPRATPPISTTLIPGCAMECDRRRHTLIPDQPGLLLDVGRARFVSLGENCSLLRGAALARLARIAVH